MRYQGIPILPFFFMPLVLWSEVSGLDCYECYSFNKSDPNCSDPFHPAYGHLTKDCTQRKTGIIGSFPAKYCIKLIGNTAHDDTEMVFRGCSLEDLDSQCGVFEYENTRYRGCVTSCEENGCNGGTAWKPRLAALWCTVLPFVIRQMVIIL